VNQKLASAAKSEAMISAIFRKDLAGSGGLHGGEGTLHLRQKIYLNCPSGYLIELKGYRALA
jgi:hypothetical protein